MPRGVFTPADRTYLRQVAYHEAGHALANLLLGVELDPTVAMQLHPGMTWSLWPVTTTPEGRFYESVTWCAGRAANPWFGAPHDDDLAAAVRLVGAGVKDAYAYARNLLHGRHEQLNALATALLAEQTLSARQVYALVGPPRCRAW